MAATAVTLAVIAGASTLGLMIPPIQRGKDYALNLVYPNAVPDMGTLAQEKLMGELSPDDYYKYARYQGFNDEQAKNILRINESFLNAFEIIALYRRGHITEQSFRDQMTNLKFSNVNQDRMLKATEYFPNVQDLIRFAVREIYTPEIRNAFNLDAELPVQFINEASKAGVPPEQASNYWAAHWQLPGINLAFEMLHRNIITRAELDLLLKSQDVMPFWRDKITAISYSPYTRVDVRRMYRVGVLNVDDVKRAYMDLGYDEEKASKLTEFTVLYEDEEQTDLTRSNLITAYKRELLTRDELIEYFKAIKMKDQDINFWVEMAEYEDLLDDLKDLEADLIMAYKKGSIDLNEARDILLQVDVPSRYIEKILKKLETLETGKHKILSKTDLDNLLKKKFIQPVEYLERMLKIGYSKNDIQLLLLLNNVNKEQIEEIL